MNIFSKMDNLVTLTENEKILVSYIKENPEAFVKMTSAEISEASFISNATIYRLCKKMDLAGRIVEETLNLLSRSAEIGMTTEELDEIAKFGSKQAVFARDVMQGILQFYRTYKLGGVAFHDPVTVLYADDDSYFQTDFAGVRVETKGKLTRGKTVTDLYSDKQMEHNAFVVTNVDRDAFKRRVFEIMAKYGE